MIKVRRVETEVSYNLATSERVAETINACIGRLTQGFGTSDYEIESITHVARTAGVRSVEGFVTAVVAVYTKPCNGPDTLPES